MTDWFIDDSAEPALNVLALLWACPEFGIDEDDLFVEELALFVRALPEPQRSVLISRLQLGASREDEARALAELDIEGAYEEYIYGTALQMMRHALEGLVTALNRWAQ